MSPLVSILIVVIGLMVLKDIASNKEVDPVVKGALIAGILGLVMSVAGG